MVICLVVYRNAVIALVGKLRELILVVLRVIVHAVRNVVEKLELIIRRSQMSMVDVFTVFIVAIVLIVIVLEL